MARRESYISLKARLEAAQKREDIKRQARISSPKPYKKAPPRGTAYYNSYLKEDVIYQVNYVIPNLNALASGNPADTAVPAADFAKVGLLDAVPAGKSAVPIAGTGNKPARLQWYKGLDTPISGTTPWGTRSLKWGDKTGGANGQSHRSCPVGDLNPPTSFAGITTLVAVLLTPTLRQQILGETGQITLLPEEGNIQL